MLKAHLWYFLVIEHPILMLLHTCSKDDCIIYSIDIIIIIVTVMKMTHNAQSCDHVIMQDHIYVQHA